MKKVAEKTQSDSKLKLFPSLNALGFQFWFGFFFQKKKNNQDTATCFVLFSWGEPPFLYTLLLTIAVYIMVMNLFTYEFFSCVFKNKKVSSNDNRLSDVFSF